MKALQTYGEYLERYVLDQLIALVENDSSLASQSPRELRRMLPGDLNRDVSRVVNMPATFDELVKRYRTLEKEWFDAVAHGLDKDVKRGKEIFDDYESAHPIDKNFAEWEKNRFEESVKRLNAVLKNVG